MLFWLCLIVLIIGVEFIILGNKLWFNTEKNSKLKNFVYQHGEIIELSGIFLFIISGIIMAVMIILFACNYIGVDAQVEKYKEQYNAITYKVESDTCRDEFGLLNKEVIDEVQDWNENITYHKTIQRDFWVGIFIPNIYDQFETIDYTKYGKE